MPEHMVTDEIGRGELVRINPLGFDQMTARLVLGAAYSVESTGARQQRGWSSI